MTSRVFKVLNWHMGVGVGNLREEKSFQNHPHGTES